MPNLNRLSDYDYDNDNDNDNAGIAFLPDIRTDPSCRGGFETRPYVRLSRPMAIFVVSLTC